MKPELELQYRKEERSLIATRVKSSGVNLYALLNTMTRDTISTPENIESLKNDLAKLYNDKEFLSCVNMGEIVKASLKMVFKQPVRDKYHFAKKTA